MLECKQCGYIEVGEEFIGIFPPGTSLNDTNGNMCGIYACPKCYTVIYTDDFEYINKRKQSYKNKMKSRC